MRWVLGQHPSPPPGLVSSPALTREVYMWQHLRVGGQGLVGSKGGQRQQVCLLLHVPTDQAQKLPWTPMGALRASVNL